MSNPAFTPEARRTLVAVFDVLIPPREDGSVPGAGELGIASYVEEKLADAAAPIVVGLSALDELASSRGSSDFAALPPDQRTALLREFEQNEPGFLPALTFHGFAGYYQNPRVMEAIGLPPRPPYPNGYDLEPGDLSLLDAVRARPKLYR
jgi:hypothetical protein